MPICQSCNKPFSNNPIINGKRLRLHRKNCLICQPLRPKRAKHIIHSCKYCGDAVPDLYGKVCKKCYHKRYRLKLKIKAINFLGGKCNICNWSGHVAAFTFHHINPDEKDFEICGTNMKTWPALEKELLKCQLLCANCHRIVHSLVSDDLIKWASGAA